MPVSSIQAAVIAAVTAIIGLLVGFALLDEKTAGELVAAASTLIATAFVIANAIIHHGVTTSAPGEDASKPSTKNA